MADPKYKPPYAFTICIGEACTRKMRTFVDLAEKLRMDVQEINEAYLDKLADEVRKDLGSS
jgi:hypothetical protein